MNFRERLGRALTRFLAVVLILALCGAVVFLLSQLNARTYSTEVRNDALVVLKGRRLPFGNEPYHPYDWALAEAYAPIPLGGHDAEEIVQQRFTDRDELDRALYDLLLRLARPKLTSEDPNDFKRGAYYVERAGRLGGLSLPQKQTLKQMQQEISVFLARSKLEDAARALREGLAELKRAGETQGARGQSAREALVEMENPAKAFQQAWDHATRLLMAAEPKSPTMPSPSPTPAPDAGATRAP